MFQILECLTVYHWVGCLGPRSLLYGWKLTSEEPKHTCNDLELVSSSPLNFFPSKDLLVGVLMVVCQEYKRIIRSSQHPDYC